MAWFPTFRRFIGRLSFPPFTTRTQSQSLLRIIALAIEQRLPLAPLLQAFAEDQSGVQQGRVHRLAELLNEGTSLPAALEQVAHVLPEDNILAIRFGTHSGTLSKTLRHLIAESDRLEDVRINERIRGTLIYVTVVVFVIVMIATFLLLRIWPTFQQIMQDFGLERLPAAFQGLIYIGRFFADYWGLVVGVILLLAWILRTEKLRRSLRRNLIRPWFDTRSAEVLQSLSVVTKEGRPIPGAISTLARYHHDPTLRRQLLFVRNEIEHGADVWNTLQTVSLLTPAEVVLMEASEIVGNRAWAMEQLATSKRRQIRRRLEWLDKLVSPVAVLGLGGAVFAMCLGVFVPLTKMILNWT